MSLRSKAVSGVKWTTMSSGLLALVQLIKVSVLVRYLDKADFGLMALIVFVMGFLNLFIDMGFSTAIIHKKDITKNEYSSLFWVNIFFSIGLFLILTIITPFIATFYNEPKLVFLLPLMCLSIVISALGRQFKTIDQKNLKFRRIAILDSFSAIIALLFAVLLAMNNYGVLALVYSTLLQFIIVNIFYLLIGILEEGIKFRLSLVEVKPFFKIGIYYVGGQVVNYFNRDVDILIVGKVFGAEILGGYSLAKQLVNRPAQIINPILTKVAAPVLVKFKHNIDDLQNNYLKLVNIISTLNITIYLGVIVFAGPIISILYGNEYSYIAFIVRILSCYMIIRSIGNPIGSLVVATGRTDLEFYWNLIVLVVIPVSILIGAGYGINGVVISILFFRILLFVPSWYFLIWKTIKIPLARYLCAIIPDYKNNLRLLFNK